MLSRHPITWSLTIQEPHVSVWFGGCSVLCRHPIMWNMKIQEDYVLAWFRGWRGLEDISSSVSILLCRTSKFKNALYWRGLEDDICPLGILVCGA